MKREAYSGTITTTGRSEALRLDKALFRQHPEFRQKARLKASVIGVGTLLVQVIDDQPAEDDAPDPVVSAYLAFLERDMAEHPERVQPISGEFVDLMERATEGVSADDEDIIPDEFTF